MHFANRYFIRFDVQRWLHLNMIDGRTRLMLTPNQLPGYAPKSREKFSSFFFSVEFSVSIGMLENIEQPKRGNSCLRSRMRKSFLHY